MHKKRMIYPQVVRQVETRAQAKIRLARKHKAKIHMAIIACIGALMGAEAHIAADVMFLVLAVVVEVI